jgi:hypothetical protein
MGARVNKRKKVKIKKSSSQISKKSWVTAYLTI